METTSAKDRRGPTDAGVDEEDLETRGEVDEGDCNREETLEPEAAALGAIVDMGLG
jgi:hypothetical protein